jgi:hypothetical protein
MNAQTMQQRARNTHEFSTRRFRGSVLTRKDRDRRNAARLADRVLKGIHAADVAPLVSPQELSALRSEEDGGCLGRVLNLLRAMGSRRSEVVAFLESEVRLMNARMPSDVMAEVFAALDREEVADCADSVEQQAFNRNPCAETARALREKLEDQRAATQHAIDALKQYEEAEESK